MIKLPDGRKADAMKWGNLIIPRVLINDLKAVWQPDAQGKRIAPIFLDTSYIPRGAEQCGNCHGVAGEGKLYAPTGDKRRKRWHGGMELERELIGYDCPVCSSGVIRQYLVDICGLPNFDMIDVDVWRDGAFSNRATLFDPIFAAQAEWSATRSPSGLLNIIGPMDSGKTFCAQLLVKNMVTIGIEARYINASDLADLAKKAVGASLPPDAYLQPYYVTPVLAVDELFRVRQRASGTGDIDYGADHILRLLNHRYAHRDTLATILVWDSDWWHIEMQSDGTAIFQPELDMAENLGMILSRAQEARWMAWSKLTGLRAKKGMENRATNP